MLTLPLTVANYNILASYICVIQLVYFVFTKLMSTINYILRRAKITAINLSRNLQ